MFTLVLTSSKRSKRIIKRGNRVVSNLPGMQRWVDAFVFRHRNCIRVQVLHRNFDRPSVRWSLLTKVARKSAVFLRGFDRFVELALKSHGRHFVSERLADSKGGRARKAVRGRVLGFSLWWFVGIRWESMFVEGRGLSVGWEFGYFQREGKSWWLWISLVKLCEWWVLSCVYRVTYCLNSMIERITDATNKVK